MVGRPAQPGRHDAGSVPARAARALLRRGLGDLAALARGAGGQDLPPGLPPRPARALPVGGAGRQHDVGHLPGHRPRPGRHRRAAARHRQDRGLRDARAARSSSPTPASSRARSRSATTWCAARSRRSPASRRTRPGPAPHHAVPPRAARARQPGGALHARGHARAHGRQPRRPARQLRPHREGPRRRRALVGLRPRPERLGVLRIARSRARPRSRQPNSANSGINPFAFGRLDRARGVYASYPAVGWRRTPRS